MKTLNILFKAPTFRDVVLRELAQANMEKLTAETVRDHANSVVKYNNSRISRLQAHLNELELE